jgi:hypothetical protein
MSLQACIEIWLCPVYEYTVLPHLYFDSGWIFLLDSWDWPHYNSMPSIRFCCLSVLKPTFSVTLVTVWSSFTFTASFPFLQWSYLQAHFSDCGSCSKSEGSRVRRMIIRSEEIVHKHYMASWVKYIFQHVLCCTEPVSLNWQRPCISCIYIHLITCKM